jgi:hypothetical protein
MKYYLCSKIYNGSIYYEKGNLRVISCKMREAGFDVSFRDCPAKGGTGGHPSFTISEALTAVILNELLRNN